MSQVISFIPRRVRPRGINPQAIPDEKKIGTYVFHDDYAMIATLRAVELPYQQPTLFYPGCGCDVLLPLLFVRQFFPGLQKINFIFVDRTDNLPTIMTVLDDVGVSFARRGSTISFWWHNHFVTLQFVRADVFRWTLPSFDVYFERAFRLMKEEDPSFERRVYAKLSVGGIILSDSGFRNIALHSLPIPKSLSAYGEMVLGRKR